MMFCLNERTGHKFYMKQKSRKGFTLIELMVAIAVIGFLSSMFLSYLGSARAKARDVRRKDDLRNIETALAVYFGNHGIYPTASSAGCGTAMDETDLVSIGLESDAVMNTMPVVPFNSGLCGDAYYAFTWNGAQSIAILTRLENADPGCIALFDWYSTGSYCNGLYIRAL